MNVISIENLWKQYRLGVIGHGTLTHDLQSWWARVRGKEDPNAKVDILLKGQKEQIEGDRFWALRDINLEVEQGEVLGIIGKNGAGKSTLLKILSRVTAPTRGNIKVNGRIASLLEVGTGFHPELTGRENIFLNGTILGMSKQEVKRKFDNIVDFSGVEDFIDTPVKRYSSGMNVRLAFAVAAHLEPEIMLVDEVLAVGDAEFQKKCLGKMKDVSQEGRTILFVSHNMAAVSRLCNKGVFLENGKIVFYGSEEEAVAEYLKGISRKDVLLIDREDREGSGEIKVVSIEFRDRNGNKLNTVMSGQHLDICFNFKKYSSLVNRKLKVTFRITTELDIPVFFHNNLLTNKEFRELPENGAFIFRLKKLPLPEAEYKLSYTVRIADHYLIDKLDYATKLSVTSGDYFRSGETPPIRLGVCLVEGDWHLE